MHPPSFRALSGPARFRRLRRCAQAALPAWFDMPRAVRLVPLTHWENATWRVEVDGQRFLLRVHRVGYRTRPEISAELAWLDKLAEAGIPSSRPIATRSGERVVSTDLPGIPGPRFCTLLSWCPGRIHRRPQPHHLRRTGALMARLHAVADLHRNIGPRPRFDPTGWFKPAFPTGEPDIDQAIDAELRPLLQAAGERAAELFDTLGSGVGRTGLIHADLHFNNVVFHQGTAAPIDFDDCGIGPYVYDLAIPAMRVQRCADPEGCWDALVAGYRSLRPLSDADLKVVWELTALQMPGLLGYIAARWPDPEVVSLLPRALAQAKKALTAWADGAPRPFEGVV